MWDELNASELAAAREWTAECLSDAYSRPVQACDVTEATAAQYVANWYGGGIATFKRDVEVGF